MLQREENVIVAEVDGKPMLLNLRSWTYVALNETGERIWELLAEPLNRAELLARLADEFDAPAEAIGADLDSFLGPLLEQGFLAPAQ
ncbi:MAG TPA: PqqD family protein [Allosphingosinicella sp.]